MVPFALYTFSGEFLIQLFRYDVVYVNLSIKPEWLFEKHPLGKVPAIELEDGTVLYESLILCEYLDSISSSRPLASSDALQRAQDKLLIDQFSKVCQPLANLPS